MGHTESTYDMCRLSGMTHCGLLAELMHSDGTMYRKEASLQFAKKHGLAIITVDQIIKHRRKHPLATETISPDELAGWLDSHPGLEALPVASSPAPIRMTSPATL